jgi:hypothetical protein
MLFVRCLFSLVLSTYHSLTRQLHTLEVEGALRLSYSCKSETIQYSVGSSPHGPMRDDRGGGVVSKWRRRRVAAGINDQPGSTITEDRIVTEETQSGGIAYR